MVNWRDVRLIFLIGLLMLGVLAGATAMRLYKADYFQLANLSTNKPVGKINGAASIHQPVVNPVLKIEQPAVSVFAPL